MLVPREQKNAFNWQEERALKILVPKYYGTGMCYLSIKLQVLDSPQLYQETAQLI